MPHPNVFFVDDDPSYIEGYVYSWNKKARGVALGALPRHFRKTLERTIEQGLFFDAFVFDAVGSALSVEFLLGELESRYRAAGRPLPVLVIHSGMPEDNIWDYAETLRKRTAFKRVAPLMKPSDTEEQEEIILKLLAEGESALSFEASVNKAPPPSGRLERALDALTAFQGAARPEREATEEALEDALLGLDPEEMMRPYRDSVQPQDPATFSIDFSDATGRSLAGRVALSWEEACALRREDKATPVFLAVRSGGGETIEALADAADTIDGIVVIGHRAVHFKQAACNFGKSALMTEPDLAQMQGVTFTREEGLRVARPEGVVSLRTGDFVTLDIHNSRLYLGAHPVTKAEPSPLYRAFVRSMDELLNLCTEESDPALRFTAILAKPAATDLAFEEIGLSRTEDYFLEKENRAALLEALLDPSPACLARVKEITEQAVRALFEGRRVWRTHIRLMDFKPDQFLDAPETRAAFTRTFGQRTDLRGFALAHKRPEVYRAQVEGALAGAPRDMALTFSVPCAETRDDLLQAQEILEAAEGPRRWSPELGASLETQEGIANALPFFRTCLRANKDSSREAPIFIGSNDLAADVHGIERGNDAQIEVWRKTHPFQGHPFRDMTSELKTALQRLVAAASSSKVKSVRFCLCGEQATSLSFCRELERMGIFKVSVPAEPLYLEGLKNAYNMTRIQSALREERRENQRRLRFLSAPHRLIAQLRGF